MILLADGGSTKTDWVALDKGKEIFRTRTKGLNPAILDNNTLVERIKNNYELERNAAKFNQVYFYGAGCGTEEATKKLTLVLQEFFPHAEIHVHEDMLAAVYAASQGKESIVAILGTGSNSCYFDGQKMHMLYPSLGYILMDEASGNWFGKQLIIDYYNKKMPKDIAMDFASKYDLSAQSIKENLYQREAPNTYLAHFAEFMFDHKNSEYINNLLENGFDLFIRNRILPYEKSTQVPVYFIGSIAWFFKPVLYQVAKKYHIDLKKVIRRPIDKLINYHLNKSKTSNQ
jgi:N-acetylglucosamine kinase-like BadF-type ATPase